MMRLTRRFGSAALAFGLGLAATSGTASAAFTFDVREVGGNVVASGSGTLNLAALSVIFENTATLDIRPNLGTIGVGPAATLTFYNGMITGPRSWGSGASTPIDLGTGNTVGVIGPPGSEYSLLIVPKGYQSGTPLAGTATWTGETFASLGVTPGRYTYTWGAGPTADSITVNIPEPAGVAMLILGLAGVARQRRRS